MKAKLIDTATGRTLDEVPCWVSACDATGNGSDGLMHSVAQRISFERPLTVLAGQRVEIETPAPAGARWVTNVHGVEVSKPTKKESSNGI